MRSTAGLCVFIASACAFGASLAQTTANSVNRGSQGIFAQDDTPAVRKDARSRHARKKAGAPPSKAPAAGKSVPLVAPRKNQRDYIGGRSEDNG